MTVLRISKREKNFLILDKTCLTEPKLSWGAKGLHTYLMSMPDNWRVNVFNLQKSSKNGRDAVRSFLNELEEAGYIKKSLNRVAQTGRFGGFEYLVLEVPDLKENTISPEMENQLTVKPASGNPSPENPPLINNKLINNKLINKTAAREPFARDLEPDEEEKAAAAYFKQNKPNNVVAINQRNDGFLAHAQSPEDSVIGSTLTPYQLSRIDALVQKLNLHSPKIIAEEIRYCMLSRKHFTACGQDFGRKLNAIRTVILRGDWQTPAEVVLEARHQITTNIDALDNELKAAYAEENHFKRLFDCAKENAKANLAFILESAQIKVRYLEAKMRDCIQNPDIYTTH
jgi:hypothetical protein